MNPPTHRHPRSFLSAILPGLFVFAVLSSLFAAAPPLARAEVFEVGDGMSYAAIGDVPWESLMPGDTVRIHWRAAPYNEKWVIGRRGTEAAPITIQGVAGPGGERPVIDGRGATTRAELDFRNEVRGVIKVGSSNRPEDTLPGYIIIEGLEIRSGRAPFNFTNPDGSSATYSDNAAAIYVEKAEFLTIRNCALHDSGNGLFIGSFDGETHDILVESNSLYDNGISGSAYQHNSYTAAIDITFQFNHYGPLRDGCDGNNLKDRSAGLVVRHNWVESGNRQLDLVDAEDSAVLVGHPSYGETFVYGNVLVEHEGDGNSQIIHYGGDSGTEGDYRKGTLHLFNNTIVSTRSGNTTLLRLSTNEESADVRNNVVYVTASGDRLAMLSENGDLTLMHNWMKPGRSDSHGTLSGSITDDGSGVSGAAPGFVDEAGQDYHLALGSSCIDAAATLNAAVLPDHDLSEMYVRHQAREARPVDSTLDIGAFEYCAPGMCTTVRPDGGTPGLDSGTPGPDGSVPGVDSGTGSPDGSTPGADGGSTGTDDGGCGCRVVVASSPERGRSWGAIVVFGVLALFRVGRRARRGRRS